jgi:hypothetical protein
MRIRRVCAAQWLTLSAAFVSSTLAHAQDAALVKRHADSAFAAQRWTEAASGYRTLAVRSDATWYTWYRLGFAELPTRADSATDAFVHASQLAPPGPRAFAFEALADAYSHRGVVDSAFTALDNALLYGNRLSALHSDTALAGLRGDARFAAFERHVDSVARPCAHRADSRRLDFWLGDWDVRDPSGNHVGTSHEELALNDCVLVENWASDLGSTGRSFNRFNLANGHWEQSWYDDQGGTIEFRDGIATDGRVQFYATIPGPHGSSSRRRLTFTILPGHRVRQLSERSNDGGKTWSVEYDLYYQRRAPG